MKGFLLQRCSKNINVLSVERSIGPLGSSPSSRWSRDPALFKSCAFGELKSSTKSFAEHAFFVRSPRFLVLCLMIVCTLVVQCLVTKRALSENCLSLSTATNLVLSSCYFVICIRLLRKGTISRNSHFFILFFFGVGSS